MESGGSQARQRRPSFSPASRRASPGWRPKKREGLPRPVPARLARGNGTPEGDGGEPLVEDVRPIRFLEPEFLHLLEERRVDDDPAACRVVRPVEDGARIHDGRIEPARQRAVAHGDEPEDEEGSGDEKERSLPRAAPFDRDERGRQRDREDERRGTRRGGKPEEKSGGDDVPKAARPAEDDERENRGNIEEEAPDFGQEEVRQEKRSRIQDEEKTAGSADASRKELQAETREKRRGQGRGEDLDRVEKRCVRKTRTREQQMQVEIERGKIRYPEGLEPARGPEPCGDRVDRDRTKRNRSPHGSVQHGGTGEYRRRKPPGLERADLDVLHGLRAAGGPGVPTASKRHAS